jgi:hypothetical protein
MSIIMPKVSLFGIKIVNKLWKTRNNLLTGKSVIKTLEPKIGTGDRAGGEFLRYDNNIQ